MGIALTQEMSAFRNDPRSDLKTLTRPAMPAHAPHPQLRSARKCDVCVVGGGVMGLITSLLCARSGLSVLLIERARVASGESRLSSGQVTELLDLPFSELLRIHGAETLQLFTESHRSAIHQLLQLSSSAVSVPGYLFTEHDHQIPLLRRELEALAQFHISSTLQKHTPLPFPVLEAIRVEHQALTDPAALVASLREQATAAGVEFFEDTPALEISPPHPPHIRSIKVRTPHGSVSCDWCVLATHSPTLEFHPVHFEMKPKRRYTLQAELKSSLLMEGIYFDLPGSPQSSHHSISPVPSGVQVSGMDHPVGQSSRPETERILRLEDYTRSRFEVDHFTQAWSGQILESADGLPYLGHSLRSDRILFVTGFGRNGLSIAVMAANLLLGRIQSSKQELFERLSPFRLRNRRTWMALAGGGFRFLEQRTAPLLQKVPLPDPDGLAPGEACIGESNGKLVALSRDEEGALHSVLATCTHLGGELRYNEMEKTWDCACHGSRFSREGRVLCGPALRDLEKVAALQGKDTEKEEAA